MNQQETNNVWVADKLYHEFIQAKAIHARKPVRDSAQLRSNPCWMRIAKVVLQLNAKPADYINAQFKYSKSTVLANNLHGVKAQNNYRALLAEYGNQRVEKPKDNEPVTSVMVEGVFCRIEQVRKLAGYLAKIKYPANTSDPVENKRRANMFDGYGIVRLDHPNVVDIILSNDSSFDPLGVIVLAGCIEDYANVFLEEAKNILDKNPGLKQAIDELDLPTTYVLEQ